MAIDLSEVETAGGWLQWERHELPLKGCPTETLAPERKGSLTRT